MNKKNGDWTITDTKKIFENDFFKVFEDDVIQPDGKEGKFATVEFRSGVSVLPVDAVQNVYLTRQFRYAIEREDIEAVSGNIEDEEILETAKREASEELGIKAENWTNLGRVEDNTSITKTTAHLFLAEELSFGKPDPEGTEKIEMVKMPLAEAVEKVLSGEITHGQTCVLILKANHLLNFNRKKLN